MVAITPAEDSVAATLSTLRFAETAKKCKNDVSKIVKLSHSALEAAP